ncbi:hypothetical protein AN958_02188 [Leucoagaricus sp. SymC.cos]|nr:hypothetical protein AN958_02188 [Leucoagaricus sp. SymC.cos]
MHIRLLLALGVLFSVFTLGILTLFFLDINLPTELHAFKLAALSKLKDSPLPSGKLQSSPVEESIVNEDDIEDSSWEDAARLTVPPALDNDSGYSSYSMPLSSTFETTIPNGAAIHGFSVFDNLVMCNGIFYIVTNNQSIFPSKDHIIRPPPPTHRGKFGSQDPNPEDIQFIIPDELAPLLGDSAMRFEGFSWINYDVSLFMNHYYHWWGEVILGGWRTYSLIGLDADGTFHPERLRLPDRMLFPLVEEGKWRDKAGVDGPLMHAAFPRASFDERDHWLDLIKLNLTFVFERALIVNREAAHSHPFGGRWFKMIAGTQELKVAEFDPASSSPSHEGFWSPLRKSLTHNLLGYLPMFASLTDRAVISPASVRSKKPVVTYINRQGTNRRLTDESHQSLVDALRELEKEGVCEVQIVRFENVPLKEQVRLAARSSIMVAVHGNGLTHQLWMPPSARSAIIEIVYPQAYSFDYEMLARNMGHKHYTVWNDTLIAYAKGTYHQVRLARTFDIHYGLCSSCYS